MFLNCGAGELLRVPWTARRSNQSILKEISPGYSLEGLMLGIWHVNSLDHILYIKDNGDEYEMETDDVEYFKHYLDLERDYEAIQKEVQDNGFVSEAIEYGKGVRVLNQDPFEMLFSFIVSQNNNIPRIIFISSELGVDNTATSISPAAPGLVPD